MKSPITKIAIAAAVLVAVLIGLSQFGGSSAGVAWGEVAKKVEASQSLIFRSRGTNSESLEGKDGPDYSMNYLSGMKRRADGYKDGRIIRSFYQDFEAGTGAAVFHSVKRYIREDYSDKRAAQTQRDMMNPKYLVQTILSCEHKELGRKTIEGVLCEGLETTDPAFFGSLPRKSAELTRNCNCGSMRKRSTPSNSRGKMKIEAEGQVMSSEYVLDQFQWDVAIDPSVFEPNIPPDYEQM